MWKQCEKCNATIPPKRNANNVKYCEPCRKVVRAEQSEQSHKRYLEKKARDPQGKIQCLICGRYYKKVLSHVWQKHGVFSREYKTEFGIDMTRGLVTEEYKEHKRNIVKQNYDTIVKGNLLTRGRKTRFKKGDPTIGRYQRSAETMERLKQQSFIKKTLK